jgi:ribosomal protein S13
MSTHLQKRNARIVEAVKARAVSLAEIGALHGICHQRVSQIAAQAGAARHTAYCGLTDEEKAAIVTLHEAGVPHTHISERIGRAAKAAHAYLVREGLHMPANDKAPWSASEDRVLRRKYGKPRSSASTIATELGRTRNEVIGRAYRLGLNKGSRKKSA